VTVSPISRWALDPAVVHLNHGSFGGCLRSVLAEADALRARLEANPMRFMVLEWQDELDRARAALAAFVGAPAERLVFVPSSTTGVAIALGSVALAAGDAVLVTDHGYRAVANQVARLASTRALEVASVRVPLPFDADAFVAAVAAALTPRTRVAIFDHITSPTALVLPVERLVPLCAARGIATIVDGAHAPGQLPLDIAALGATYYVGNNHKWLCAPKGSGFLVAAADAPVVPVVTSHGATPEYGPPNRMHAELDWSGTHDPVPHLAVPAAIAHVAAEGGGWPAIIARNHATVLAMCERLARRPPGPAGAMAALPITLPPGTAPLLLERQLLEAGWEVPVVDFPTGPMVRISAHLYNSAEQADLLARELHARRVTL
jgi:isopenicillin-N epimerase